MPHSPVTIARLMTADKIITSYCLKQVNLINTPVGEIWSSNVGIHVNHTAFNRQNLNDTDTYKNRHSSQLSVKRT
jgi:hypothetical protein